MSIPVPSTTSTRQPRVGLLQTPPDNMLYLPVQRQNKSKFKPRHAGKAKIINITHNNYGTVRPVMVSNGTQTPKMGVELTTDAMPDLIDRQRRLDTHLGNRNMTLKETAAKLDQFLHPKIDQMDEDGMIFELEALQGEAAMVLAVPNMKGRVLESMLNNNHTLAYMVWTNYLIHNKIPIKDKKISEIHITKELIAKLEKDHIEFSDTST